MPSGDKLVAAPAAHIALVQSEAERLAQYLSTLSPAAWRQPSACQGWEVGDVVAHLTDGAQFYIRTISRGVQGDTSPSLELAQSGTMRAEVIAQHAIASRERLGDALLPTFRTQYAQLCSLLRQLHPEDWQKLCYYTSEPRQRPAQEFLALSVQELAIHGWDIRSSFEPDFHLAAESVAVLVQHTPRRLARPQRAVFPLPVKLSAPVRYRWMLHGAVTNTYDIVVEHSRCRMQPADTSAAQVTFHSAAETFILLQYQRLTLVAATAMGNLVSEGDRELLAAFDRWLQGKR
jgi:uncharacterized protein (TIGR03083 family)